MRHLEESILIFHHRCFFPNRAFNQSSVIARREEKKRKRALINRFSYRISRAEARDGQQYPCPAHQHSGGSLEVGRAADPKRTMSCRIQRKSVRTSVHPSIRLSIQSPTMAGWLVGGDGQMDGQTDVRTDFLFGSAAQKKTRSPHSENQHFPIIENRKQKKDLRAQRKTVNCAGFQLFPFKSYERKNKRHKVTRIALLQIQKLIFFKTNVCSYMVLEIFDALTSAWSKKTRIFSSFTALTVSCFWCLLQETKIKEWNKQ